MKKNSVKCLGEYLDSRDRKNEKNNIALSEKGLHNSNLYLLVVVKVVPGQAMKALWGGDTPPFNLNLDTRW
jgi:hypothetical protein